MTDLVGQFIRHIKASGLSQDDVNEKMGNWFDTVGNWSQGHFPTRCETVIVQNDEYITITPGQTVIIGSLTVQNGSDINVNSGAY